MRRLLPLLVLATAAAAAPQPMTAEKLQLIPGLSPKERRDLARKCAPLMAKGESVRKVLLDAGIDERIVDRLEELAAGALLVERYAHSLVLDAPDLTEKQKELLEYMHPSVLASQVALYVHRQKVLRGSGLASDDPLYVRISNSYDQQIRQMEKRYWWIVGYVLTVEQRAKLREILPQPYRRPPNIQGHLYQLPNLTPSQANRIRALLTEFESETVADSADIQILQRRLSDGGLTAAERRRFQARIEAATDRNWDVVLSIVATSKEIITEEQYRYLDALPPLVTPQEHARNPGEILKEMGLTPEQEQKLEPLGEKVMRRAVIARRKADRKLKDMEGEIGDEAPQRTTMQMMQQNVRTETRLASEEVARTALLDIMRKGQVLGWIIAR